MIEHPGSLFSSVKHLTGQCFVMLSLPFWSAVSLFSKKGELPRIKNYQCGGSNTVVDSFWGIHTVVGPRLALVRTAYQSKKYLDWRFSVYPFFREFMELWGKHDNQVILDYGCGPGNDLVGFLVYTNARKVIGIDISEKALGFASRRIALHNVDANRIELVCISDSATTIPIEDNAIDYIYCEGVLHHTTCPEDLIKEFHRVLKPGSQACIMVYNRDSIWFHLYTAYEQMIIRNRFSGMNIYEAFAKTTDTEECPVARCYQAQEFIAICNEAGFDAEYVGGYFSRLELNLFKKYRRVALRDDRLGAEHKDFLKSLVLDEKGFPMYRGKHAGIGGVYKLYKPA
jgi:ubiquinone/menaquinone biosynthesis C-methylase UbiE